MVASMVTPQALTPAPPDPADLRSASPRWLTLEQLAAQLRQVQPPAPYRLALDSGVQYRNVCQAMDRPLHARWQTWLRLLGSLDMPALAATTPEDFVWPGANCPVVALDGRGAVVVAPENLRSLRDWRMQLGWSRRALARRAGLSSEAVAAAESGCCLARTLQRLCAAMGLRIFVVLPTGHGSVQELWAARAPRLLAQPASFAALHGRLRAPGYTSASIASAPEIARSKARLARSASSPRRAQDSSYVVTSPPSIPKAMSR